MTNALREAESLGLDTVQIFTKNQQQWHAKPLTDSAVRAWLDELNRLGWRDRTVSHASYLANLASPDDTLWERSIALMIEEIERCEALSIPFLVHHPGAFTSSTREAGLARIAAAYARLLRATPGFRTVCCLEGTVGAGTQLGGTLDDLADLRRLILDLTPQPERVGFCLDTCHLHASGEDLSTSVAAADLLRRFDHACGLPNLRVVHLNDSKGACGSHLDRHEHIGQGTVGGSPQRLAESGFAVFVNHPALRDVPKILETPKGVHNATPWDSINLQRLKSLLTTPARSKSPAASLASRPSTTPAKAKAKRVAKDKARSKPPSRSLGLAEERSVKRTSVSPKQKPARRKLGVENPPRKGR